MDIAKIIGLLVAFAGPVGIYINYLNNVRINSEKSLDRLKQISEEIRAENPNKWWVEQAFESIYKTNLSFDVIKILIDSKVRHSSIANLSKITRRRIDFNPHNLERRFTKHSWQRPEVVKRRLTWRWIMSIAFLLFSLRLFLLDRSDLDGFFISLMALILELIGFIAINLILDDYRRIWIVYRRRDFGKFHNWFINRMGRNLPLDI